MQFTAAEQKNLAMPIDDSRNMRLFVEIARSHEDVLLLTALCHNSTEKRRKIPFCFHGSTLMLGDTFCTAHAEDDGG